LGQRYKERRNTMREIQKERTDIKRNKEKERNILIYRKREKE
jgi:hypothetical protein